jgi:hypothetical protein
MTLPCITYEKLEDYLGIWNRLASSDYRSKLDITLVADYDCSRFPFGPWIYTLTYGEEKRELTYEQALRVKDWLDSLAQEKELQS